MENGTTKLHYSIFDIHLHFPKFEFLKFSFALNIEYSSEKHSYTNTSHKYMHKKYSQQF